MVILWMEAKTRTDIDRQAVELRTVFAQRFDWSTPRQLADGTWKAWARLVTQDEIDAARARGVDPWSLQPDEWPGLRYTPDPNDQRTAQPANAD